MNMAHVLKNGRMAMGDLTPACWGASTPRTLLRRGVARTPGWFWYDGTSFVQWQRQGLPYFKYLFAGQQSLCPGLLKRRWAHVLPCH